MESDQSKLPSELLNYVAMLARHTPGATETMLGTGESPSTSGQRHGSAILYNEQEEIASQMDGTECTNSIDRPC